jgi:glycosyltransferase involved in cell wall biosynthesis
MPVTTRVSYRDPMRICLLSSEHGPNGGIGFSVARLGRLLAREHEVTVVHTYEDQALPLSPEGPEEVRHVVVDPSRLPDVAFSCDDHARSAAAMLAIEDAYGDSPPDYLEVPDYRGHALVPLQARNGGHPSLRGTTVAVRLRGMAELICLQDGTWPLPPHRMVFDLEREALRLADLVLWPGGDLLGVYRRCVDPGLFDSEERIRLSFEPPAAPPVVAPRSTDEPLKLLFVGRLQRVKGALALVEACLGADSPDWRLTMVGGDTNTAPLGQSMRAAIELMAAGDERIEMLDPLPHQELQARYAEHDVLVVPSAFECWSNVALEAMRAGLPVLATPVGGLSEIVEDGVTGWRIDGTNAVAIRTALGRLLDDRGEIERVRASGEIFRRFESLADEDRVLDEYRAMLERRRRPAPILGTAKAPPLVTGIVPYYGETESIGDTVRSLLSQTHSELEVIIVNDGHFEADDRVLTELAGNDRVRVLSQPNRGETGARNFGAIDADGAYLAFLDADNTLEPDFVARAVAMLEADPELAYVTCWLRFVEEGDGALEQLGSGGYAPLGNAVRSDESINSDGDAISVMPRRLFSPLGYRFERSAALYGDWELYRCLRDDGRFGTVIPELLADYRVRRASLSQTYTDRGHSLAWDEAVSRRRAAKLEWRPSA